MDRVRVGLISDTHEAEQPLKLVEQLAAQGCDYHIHMGDIGGALDITRTVRQIKQDPAAPDRLPAAQRAQFHAMRAAGVPAVRAYLNSALPQDPYSSAARMNEAYENYVAIVRAVRALPNARIMCGNTDRGLMEHPAIAALFRGDGRELVTQPELIDLGERALILWPSLRVLPHEAEQLEAAVDRLLEDVAGKRQVAVIGHEQLFKGPVPPTYRRRVREAGLEYTTVPHYEPSRSWRYLIRLFRGLPADVETLYVHGHVHDPDEVLGAGASYLKRRGGLQYRLYGAGMPLAEGAPRNGARRVVPTNCVPLDRVAVLTLGDCIAFEVLPPDERLAVSG